MKKYFLNNFFYNYANHRYTIIIGQKLYKVTISDLKHRRLVIIDSLSKLNQKYLANILDKEWSLRYLAITIFLHLH